MNDMPKHAIPAAPEPRRRDHLWVLFVIAACVLAEVWASWVGIGAISGFPVIMGKVPTDWVLAVAMEAYWGYALYAWLVASPGPRSRAMAMWSCAVVFALSLAGQVLYHELTVPPGTTPGRRVVIGFVTSLPVIVLALIAVLIHLRHADREEAAEAQRLAAEAERLAGEERTAGDERTALRRQLAGERQAHAAQMETAEQELADERAARTEAQREAALRATALSERNDAQAALEVEQQARQAAETARVEAERLLEEAEAKAERLTRKLERTAGARGTRSGTAAVGDKNRSAAETAVPKDFDAQAAALAILDAEPGITGRELGERCGRSERWGQDFKKQLATRAAGPGPGSPED